jgi:RND family efflux transporter MFP subunit
LILAASAAALMLSAAACSKAEPAASAAAPPEPERRVDVAAFKIGLTDVEAALQISGNLVPQTRVGVTAKLPGTLSTINVDLGTAVRAGQTLATLDRREIDAQVDAAEATVNVAHAGLDAAEAALANATLEQDRAKNLFDRGAVPKQRLDAAETAKRAATAQRDLAKANVAQADAALRRAREVQRDTTLVSPIDGVIVERNLDAGSQVAPGDKPIVVVADLRTMKLEAGVSELEAGRLKVGMPVRVTVQARPGETFEGRLATIAPEVDARNRHFAIQVRVSNPRGVLLAGMYGSAAIPLERAAQVVAVPRDAIVTRDGKRVALRVESAVLRQVPVTEGLSDGRLVQISAGLQAGDVVVADARQDVAVGSKVNPVFAR